MKKALALSLMLAFINSGSVAWADDASSSPNEPAASSDGSESGAHHHHHGFGLGLCVGQTLAQSGIILPPHQPGQRPQLTSANQAAFKAAMQSCKAQFEAAKSGPSSGTAN